MTISTHARSKLRRARPGRAKDIIVNATDVAAPKAMSLELYEAVDRYERSLYFWMEFKEWGKKRNLALCRDHGAKKKAGQASISPASVISKRLNRSPK